MLICSVHNSEKEENCEQKKREKNKTQQLRNTSDQVKKMKKK